MRLVVSGEWFGGKGLLEVEVRDLLPLSRPEDIPLQRGFLVVSYDLTEELLGVPIKRSAYPSLLFLRTGGVRELSRTPAGAFLKPEGATLRGEEFRERIGRVKDYIERGDVYQINLTSGFLFSFRGDPLDVFLRFFSRQPVPFAFFLDAGDFFLMSGSMELFLKKEGSRLESRPIKGTGRDPEAILSSEKERAENLMITDMMRNDIGRVARAGSVRVRELFRVERYRTLCQMLSIVEGETEGNLPHILRHTFPPASVTGAPKRRAVEIIEELEPHPRGYYCGAAGFVKENGDFTLSVLIRTAYGGGKQLTYFAGCGIVWDSDPLRETEELLLKVRAFYGDRLHPSD
ncbi:MAG TPA: anthranilate synthase component I family protein [Aquifex aeolicus]|uniref:Anthranilate synthase component I family protein n=1 Tax=Aquifex aeolicus TaxID=63363 RepID=A0A7C5Q8U8_AQUAO|nr:anthranilate synthase component I family protein [Aquifex aeolicus]